MAQSVKWSLPSPEDLGSNPFSANFWKEHLSNFYCSKDENKEKDNGNGSFLKLYDKLIKIK